MYDQPDPYALANYQSQMAAWQAQQGNNQNNVFMQLLQNANQQQNNAFNANQSRYNDSFQELVGNRNAQLSNLAGFGQSMLDTDKNNFNSANARLAQRGLSAGTQALTNVGVYNDNLHQTKDLLTQRLNDTLQNTMQPITNLQASRNDNYPNLSNVYGQLGQYGAGGGNIGSGGFGGFGGVGGLSAGAMPGAAGPGQTVQNTPGVQPPPAPVGSGFGQLGSFSGPRFQSGPPTLQRFGPTNPGPQKDTQTSVDNQNNPYNPWNQTQGMLNQGYQTLGNNNYVRPGSGIGGNGLLASQYVSGPPPYGTSVQQGRAQFLPTAPAPDPLLRQLAIGRLAQGPYGYGAGLPGSQQPYQNSYQPQQGQPSLGYNQGFNAYTNALGPTRNDYQVPTSYQQQSPFGEMQYGGGKSPYVMDGVLGGQNPNAGMPMSYLSALTRPQY